jgi:hypothetical protein
MAQEEKKRRVQAIFSSSPEDSGAKAEHVRNVCSKRTAKREKAGKKRGSGKRRPYDPMPMDVDWPKYLTHNSSCGINDLFATPICGLCVFFFFLS